MPSVPSGHFKMDGGPGCIRLSTWRSIGGSSTNTCRGSSRTYTRELAITLLLVMLGYLVRLSAALAATDWIKWREGGWAEIAMMAAGHFGTPLAVMLAIGGMISALALFNALLLSYSR